MSTPIVYFAGAIRGDRAAADAMKAIVQHIKFLGFTVLTEHVVTDDPVAAFAGKAGIAKDALSAVTIERQDIAWLDTATHVIAEISGASTGTGREIEYARTKGALGKIPAKILCLYRTDREFFASPMIRGMTPDRYSNVSVRSYNDTQEAQEIVTEFLRA